MRAGDHHTLPPSQRPSPTRHFGAHCPIAQRDMNDSTPSPPQPLKRSPPHPYPQVKAYCPIVQRHMNDPFTEDEKRWQQVRRGR